MNKYKVNVNGTDYEITIELMDANAPVAAPAQASAPAATPAPAVAPAQASAPAGGEQVTCPMPGSILAVNVNVGDTVSEGQVLMILEAMKMENEIMAPCAGTITSVNVTKGATVESGAALCTIA